MCSYEEREKISGERVKNGGYFIPMCFSMSCQGMWETGCSLREEGSLSFKKRLFFSEKSESFAYCLVLRGNEKNRFQGLSCITYKQADAYFIFRQRDKNTARDSSNCFS